MIVDRGVDIGVVEIFDKCQHVSDCTKEIRQLTKIFEKANFKSFLECFIDCLKRCLTVKESSHTVKRVLAFTAKFVISVNAKENCGEEHKPKLLNELWKFIDSNCVVTSAQVRLHLCQLIANLFNEMDDEADIELEIYSILRKSLLKLLKDKNSLVRVEAVFALSRLQDVTDDDCPIVRAFLHHLVNDPCFDVRKAIVNEIGISKLTLPVLVTRTRDVKDSIRKAAYDTFATKVHFKCLSIAKRIDILKNGLHDRSEKVRQSCANSLLEAWMKQCQGDLFTFLKCLDVIDATDTTKDAFDALITKFELEDAIVNFDLLDEKRIMKHEVTEPEGVFYWRCLCERVAQHPDGLKKGNLDKVLPNFFDLSDFISKKLTESGEEDDLIKQVEKIFIFQQLMALSLVYDFVDESERRRGIELAKQILLSPLINEHITTYTIKLLEKVMPNQSNRIGYLVEMISDIREMVDVVEEPLDQERIRQTTLKIARLKVEININRDELETLVSKQVFDGAQAKKERIEKLESILAQLTVELQPKMKEICQIKDDPLTLQKCLLILCAILEAKSLQLAKPTLLSLIDSLILPSIKNVDECVRSLAVKALGLSCVADVEIASAHFFLLLQICQVDCKMVILTAIKSVFDILLCHSFNLFSSEEENGSRSSLGGISNNVEPQHTAKTTNKLLNIFLEKMDSEVAEVHTVVCEGLCKLLMARRLMSVRCVTRLIVMWYNPITEENYHLRNILGVFFQIFASNKINQELVVEAFLPTLNTLFDAPRSSPLYQINVLEVAKFMIELLRPLRDQQVATEKVTTFHDDLAIRICEEALVDPYSCKVAVLIKTLKSLRLSADVDAINRLEELCLNMKEVIGDNRMQSMIQAFHKQLSNRKGMSSDANNEDSEGHVSESPDDDVEDDEEEFEENENDS